MRKVRITRAKTTDGMIGILTVNDFPVCLTMERPWDKNKINVSCIPPGGYFCKRINSPKYGDTFQVCDVMGRTYILFHAGNTINDSKGCILFGTNIGEIDNLPAVMQSGKARYEFMKSMEGIDLFELEIS